MSLPSIHSNLILDIILFCIQYGIYAYLVYYFYITLIDPYLHAAHQEHLRAEQLRISSQKELSALYNQEQDKSTLAQTWFARISARLATAQAYVIEKSRLRSLFYQAACTHQRAIRMRQNRALADRQLNQAIIDPALQSAYDHWHELYQDVHAARAYQEQIWLELGQELDHQSSTPPPASTRVL